MMKTLRLGIFGIGLYQVSMPLMSLAQTYYDQFQRTFQDSDGQFLSNGERLRRLYGGQKDQYVVITGSSDGIGRVTALQMAKYGFNLKLVSRTQDKLEKVKAECLSLNPNIDVQIQSLDFSKASVKDYRQVFSEFEKEGSEKKLRMVINNVGVIDRAKIFELSPQEIQDLIKVNIHSQVFMTLNAKRKFQKDQQNCLVHLSSILGDMSLPFHGVYSGTKTFNKVFGRMIYMGKYPVSPDTLIVKPGLVTTGMTEYHKDFSSVDPEDTVKGIVREMGVRGYSETNGAFWHNCMGKTLPYYPDFEMHFVRQQAGKMDKPPYK